MISVAEEANTLDQVLVDVADGLERRTVRRLDLAVRLLEPMMLLVLAAIVLVRGHRPADAGDQDEQRHI
jgi:type II secretory pathway component PulF